MEDTLWLREILQPGEYVLWSGRPQKGNLFTAQEIFMIPFSIFWCGFAISWEVTAIQSAPVSFRIFGIPFVLMGLYITVGRFLVAAYMRSKTFYAVTANRLIRKRGNRIDSLSITHGMDIRVSYGKGNLGTISFGRRSYYRGAFFNSPTGFPDMEFAFKAIADVSRVSRIIEDAARQKS